MLKFVDFRVCFQEVPDEISLCINISNCPHKCKGCHSPYLQEDIGHVLTTAVLDQMIESNSGITCVCFMGGDNDIPCLHTLAKHVKDNHRLLTAWYTGLTFGPQMGRPICEVFDFIKIGPYMEQCGPLTNPNTNQRFYTKGSAMKKMDANPYMWYDTTNKFWTDESKD